MNINYFKTSALLIVIILIAASCSTPEKQQDEGATAVDSAAVWYSTNCASCHGEKLNGFVDRRWKYGETRDSIMMSIASGYAEAGMPTFEAMFSEEQRGKLADFIIKRVSEADKYEFEEVKSAEFVQNDRTLILDTIVANITKPWAMAFLPGGDMLVTEVSGVLYRIDQNLDSTRVSGVPEVYHAGQGGLLDVELHPNFAENSWVYISYSKSKMDGETRMATTAIIRGKLNGNKLEEVEELFEAQPYHRTRHHYGSRIVFGNDGYMYFSVGDRGRRDENPQDLTRDPGKIHRLKDDGSIPDDNPFVGQQGANASIFSYGHRNPQGLIKHPVTGEIWDNEHGPRGGDELNLIHAGKNYGWPVISYGINYDGSVFTTETQKEGMEQPLTYWVPSIAPSGFAVIDSDKYPGWEGDFLIGSLRFRYLNRVKMNDGEVVEEESLLKNIGRVRFVDMGPDGYIYVGVEEPGFVFRLKVKEK